MEKYIVYITINLCNGKFYIGVHRTNPDVFDGYIGCGIYRQTQANRHYAFHKAVCKYGYNNFKRNTLAVFPDTQEGKQEAYSLEKILVNEYSLKNKNCYNTSLGGRENECIDLMKTIYQFDLNGNYLRSFRCARDAAKFIDPEHQNNIRAAIKNNCQGLTNSSYGYYWSYTKIFRNANSNITPIAQYTVQGKFLRTYKSIAEAEVALSLNSISQAISKKGSAGGYQWRYFNGDTSNISTLINIKTKNEILPIVMYDKKYNLIGKFNSVKQCINTYPELKASQINRVLNKTIKSHKGYVFEYQDKDIV